MLGDADAFEIFHLREAIKSLEKENIELHYKNVVLIEENKRLKKEVVYQRKYNYYLNETLSGSLWPER